jgi:hypothetical protein
LIADVVNKCVTTEKRRQQVLLIESDPQRRTQLSAVLRSTGFSVVAVDRIADIELWPAGRIVITDAAHFTPWWTHVGAAHVIVLADSAKQGAEACAQGATGWVDRGCDPEALLDVLCRLDMTPAKPAN